MDDNYRCEFVELESLDSARLAVEAESAKAALNCSGVVLGSLPIRSC
ncbi:hypothetical protein CASFOL_000877 [Castilleja foliolosa]|uniref:Uncharacterized protein n=1 Tax=Castilleja foliolosa TaxID=1961234 RepID=A0ABD3EEF6_9LAMI